MFPCKGDTGKDRKERPDRIPARGMLSRLLEALGEFLSRYGLFTGLFQRTVRIGRRRVVG
jgi:hypothetical protein